MPLLDKNLAGHGDTLLFKFFDRTSQKYNLDFSVHIFKRLGIQSFFTVSVVLCEWNI